ncbi:MAG TPA: IS481 family transposase [Gemmatimonadales bacterium]|nr:IS481 family transposase [Gemmatimonadales bacterium]
MEVRANHFHARGLSEHPSKCPVDRLGASRSGPAAAPGRGARRPGRRRLARQPAHAYKWRHRFLTEGPAGLLDRSSRPHCSPRRTASRVVQRMIQLRTTRRLTGPEIAATLRLPVATVGRWLRRQGLGRLKQPGSDQPRPRYQRERPGELLHVDLKPLPRFVTIGHRIHGDHSKVGRRRGLGVDYLHVAVDDATRLAHAEVLPAQDGPACAAFLTRTLSWCAGLGITIERVMTDNAFAYTGRAVGAVLATAAVRHLRTRPYSPQTNGKAERFIQTCLRGWAYKRPYRTSAARTAAFPAFLDFYNTARDHFALGHVPPLLHFLSRGP